MPRWLALFFCTVHQEAFSVTTKLYSQIQNNITRKKFIYVANVHVANVTFALRKVLLWAGHRLYDTERWSNLIHCLIIGHRTLWWLRVTV
jgi:hypothetical protein